MREERKRTLIVSLLFVILALNLGFFVITSPSGNFTGAETSISLARGLQLAAVSVAIAGAALAVAFFFPGTRKPATLNPALIPYIRQAVKGGKTDSQIRKALLSRGIPSEDAMVAIDFVRLAAKRR